MVQSAKIDRKPSKETRRNAQADPTHPGNPVIRRELASNRMPVTRIPDEVNVSIPGDVDVNVTNDSLDVNVKDEVTVSGTVSIER